MPFSIGDILVNFIPISTNLDKKGLLEYIMTIVQGLSSSVKVISLIGGAASGKSTLAAALANFLTERGIRADFFGTDDFLIGDRTFRRTHFEGREPRAKYDFVLMNDLVQKIRENSHDQISVPTYDPVSGEAIVKGAENYSHLIGPLQVLIVEGDFHEVVDSDLIIYVHMDDEARLQNRLHRDTTTRNEADTIKIRENFQLRQITQHIPYTFPTIYKADYIICADVQGDDWSYDLLKHSIGSGSHSA